MTVDAIYPRPTLYGARRVDLICDALPFGRLWQRARIAFDCWTAK
jgi:hypothetical protein